MKDKEALEIAERCIPDEVVNLMKDGKSLEIRDKIDELCIGLVLGIKVEIQCAFYAGQEFEKNKQTE